MKDIEYKYFECEDGEIVNVGGYPEGWTNEYVATVTRNGKPVFFRTDPRTSTQD